MYHQNDDISVAFIAKYWEECEMTMVVKIPQNDLHGQKNFRSYSESFSVQ